MDITSPVTGATISGLTSPTYTLTADTAPSPNGKQWYVSTLGGTQTGATTHSVSSPFTISFFRPVNVRPLPQANATTGVIKSIPNNTYKLITRKGAAPSANNVPIVARVTTTVEAPAGTDSYSAAELKAMLSAHFGAGFANAASIAVSVTTGSL